MEKLDRDSDGSSLNIVQGNIDKLKTLFPDIFSEGKIDFDKLRETLGDQVETADERYNFTWHGKSAARRIAQTPSTGTLRPCKEESKNWDTTQNLFIEGDNLEVLKLLQKSYHKQVKMIYIDPPYNTGKEFIYPDNYKDNLDTYLEYTGQKDSEGRKFGTNAETSGRYHTNWLNMMYPRLKLARNLLRDDGVIFISIDDNEVANLRKLCDEVFGEDNFVSQFVWSGGRKNDSKLVSVSHEYVIAYVRSLEWYNQNKILWRQRKKGLEDIYSQHEKLKRQLHDDYGAMTERLKNWFKGLPDSHPAKAHKHYSWVDSRGVYFPDNISWPGGGGPKYEVLHPITNKPVKVPSRGWMGVDFE
ncbi:MAG: site-specific DNA-methyltransferase [Methylomicrobium sp.]|nr:site-specific DNA-methyltransferase [Methylomicrobium sp.]